MIPYNCVQIINIRQEYLKPCVQIMGIRNTWNHIIVYKLLILDRNTWNHVYTLYTLLVLDRNTWKPVTLLIISIRQEYLKLYHCMQIINIRQEDLKPCVHIIIIR